MSDVSLTGEPELISMDPVYYEAAAGASLGGIAGQSDGDIRNTYATNFVGMSAGANTGGISGGGSGAVISSYYLLNGASGEGSVSKEQLMTMSDALGGMFTDGNEYAAGDNAYTAYPYPVLTSNYPFDGMETDVIGYEDILGVSVTKIPIYYELYNTGDFGYSALSYDSHLQLETGSTPRLVVNDGYCIELYFSPAGYTLAVGNRVYKIVQNGTALNPSWYVTDADGAVLPWLAPQPSYIPSISQNIYRLYLPNAEMESAAAGAANIRIALFAGVGDIDVNNSAAMAEASFNPLFAPGAGIRSARHIDNIGRAPLGTYVQQLNIDFSIYRRELAAGYIANSSAGLFYSSAVVQGTFGGSYNGNAKWISGLSVTGSSDDAGLFAVNNGIIRNVTLRNASVRGSSNVGAIAGRNTNTITFCSVQQAVSAADSLSAAPIVYGTSNVGGIAGYNSGTVSDVVVVSTSGTPAVMGAGVGASVGGIVGSTVTNINNIMYLAIAPRTGTAANPVLYPFTGNNGNVGANRCFLSGSSAMRPFQTLPNGFSDPLRNYNHLYENRPETALNTFGVTRLPRFQNWGINALTEAQIVSHTNAVFPYPYPVGTAFPDAFDWPIVGEIPILTPRDAFVYYEKYADGTAGIFTRRLTDITDSDSEYIELDYLNPYGVIIESGYAIHLDSNRVNGNFNMPISYSSSNYSQWTIESANSVRSSVPVHQGAYPDLYPLPYIPVSGGNMGVLARVINNNTNAAAPVALVMALGNGNNATIAGAYLINPLFAKDLYPVHFTGNTGNRQIDVPTKNQTSTHFIRTPWHLQNIGRVNASNTSAGNNFIQEADLRFDSITLPGGGTFSYVTAAAISDGSGTRAQITAATANIVTGEFRGLYHSSGRTIRNLQLNGASANSKGIFQAVGSSGVVENLWLSSVNISGGNDNGVVASLNSGMLKNIYMNECNVSSATRAGGIVAVNNVGAVIRDVYVLGSTVAANASGTAGSITGINSGAIEHSLVLSMSAVSPVTASIAGNAGGIAGYNAASGRMTDVQYLARAPGVYPIAGAGSNGALTERAHYLSGYTIEGSAYNYYFAEIGEPKSMHELNRTSPWMGWIITLRAPVNDILRGTTPYPYLLIDGKPAPSDWPKVSTEAVSLAYYEIYDDDSRGFYDGKALNTLDNEPDSGKDVVESGY
ncbi:MAG: hypothetical protein FWF44_08900, partial [Defluviitaleaceae bacterium]|nr:hypothetical protein [Defluviitaleaceae bacterium]